MKPQLLEEEALRAQAIFSINAAWKWLRYWFGVQTRLVEPLCLVLALHVFLFPAIWVLGWLLPWPKSPVITTILEFDLQKWPKESKPKKVIDFRDPDLNR